LVQLSTVKDLPEGEFYAREDETHGESISIVTFGRYESIFSF